MLIIGIVLFGMLVGAAAQLLLRTGGHRINYWSRPKLGGWSGRVEPVPWK